MNAHAARQGAAVTIRWSGISVFCAALTRPPFFSKHLLHQPHGCVQAAPSFTHYDGVTLSPKVCRHQPAWPDDLVNKIWSNGGTIFFKKNLSRKVLIYGPHATALQTDQAPPPTTGHQPQGMVSVQPMSDAQAPAVDEDGAEGDAPMEAAGATEQPMADAQTPTANECDGDHASQTMTAATSEQTVAEACTNGGDATAPSDQPDGDEAAAPPRRSGRQRRPAADTAGQQRATRRGKTAADADADADAAPPPQSNTEAESGPEPPRAERRRAKPAPAEKAETAEPLSRGRGRAKKAAEDAEAVAAEAKQAGRGRRGKRDAAPAQGAAAEDKKAGGRGKGKTPGVADAADDSHKRRASTPLADGCAAAGCA
jgi:hypothetical protein